LQLHFPLRPRTTTLTLLVAGALATGLTGISATTAHAATGLHYQRGYSVQGSWLCYGWANGAYHCTQRWIRSSGRLISENPAWVPNDGATTRPTSRATTTTTHATTYAAGYYSVAPSGISQWAWTGHGSYTQPRGTYQGYGWGWCTSGAAMLAHDYVGGLGNAAAWTRNARARGMATGYTPRAGATAVFQPGVQGASYEGHVAHVVAVYRNGWFLVAETAFWWNGGGFGRVSYRYAHAGYGVSFIY
jgi:surface antigen